jgi:hypothetical protein
VEAAIKHSREGGSERKVKKAFSLNLQEGNELKSSQEATENQKLESQ